MSFKKEVPPGLINPFFTREAEVLQVAGPPLRVRVEQESLLLDGLQRFRLDIFENDARLGYEAKKRDLTRSVIAALKGERPGKIVVAGPRIDDRLLLENSLYHVYFSFSTREGKPVVLVTKRDALLQYALDGEDVDALVSDQQDIRDETLVERQERLISEIKLLNKFIKLEKDSQARADGGEGEDPAREAYLTDVNNQKLDRILDYIETSIEIEDEFSDLEALFDIEDRKDDDRIVVWMYPAEENMIDRVEGIPSELKNSKKRLSVQLKRSKVKKQAKRYQEGVSEDPYDRLSHELVYLLIGEGFETLQED